MGYTTSGGAGLTIRIEFLSPVPGYWYAAVSQSFTGSTTALTAPVYGTHARVVISNHLGWSVTISRSSWVYLID